MLMNQVKDVVLQTARSVSFFLLWGGTLCLHMPHMLAQRTTPPTTQTENTDQVWRESILCGRTIHMELSARISEKDWLYWDF